jgi:hypothetical protein
MKAVSSAVTVAGNPAVVPSRGELRRARSACACRAAGVSTMSLLLLMRKRTIDGFRPAVLGTLEQQM